ncbi:RNA-binding protein 42 [Culicoides brevitarsis]|uniref:RNA-binding protein 42 n=1 Tax=Culicoides brevitarsis TaxID=469753 RepID=UPI00307BB26E
MGSKRKNMEDEMSRFEAEISKASSSTNMFVPSQIARPAIGSNTFNQVQQKLASSAPKQAAPVVIPPPPSIPAFLQPRSYSSVPSPAIVSSAPKLYRATPTVNINNSMPPAEPEEPKQPMFDISKLQFEATQKLKKLKAEKQQQQNSGPNPIAEEIIKAAKASSALQSFGKDKRSAKDRKTVRVAGGQTWEDHSLSDWPDDDFRIFCGDLGNDVNDELLTRTFNKYPSFQRAKVIRDKRTSKSKGYGFVSFKDPQDFIKAMKEMDGRYVGSRPIKLRKSTWRNRSIDVVKKKEKEKQALLSMFKGN